MEPFIPVLTFLLPVLALLLAAGLTVGIKALLRKFKIADSVQMDALIDKYVKVGVDYAEQFARAKLASNQPKVPSENKMALAVETVVRELEKTGLDKVAEEIVKARIEAYLHDKTVTEGKP